MVQQFFLIALRRVWVAGKSQIWQPSSAVQVRGVCKADVVVSWTAIDAPIEKSVPEFHGPFMVQ